MRDEPTLALIGAPTDVGASERGASMGPEALRVAGMARRLAGRGLRVIDTGNLHGPLNPWQAAEGGYRHLAEVVAWSELACGAVTRELERGHLPVLLGGDHALSIGSISAVARHCRRQGRRLRVIWLDAHADFNDPSITPSGNLHGMPLACLCGRGPSPLTSMSGTQPAIRPAQVRLLGARSVDPKERQAVHDAALEVYDMRFIDEMGMRHAMELALALLDEHTHLHVSFDVDFLDPDVAPGVATTVPGGPTYREAQLCMEMIADTGRLASLDVMELNPAMDVRNRTAEVALELVDSLFGKSTLMRR